MPTVHLLIKGKVQGVFYRASARDTAKQLGITGWIKNTVDGDVEAVISGIADMLNLFIEWCWKGPSKAKVTDVMVSPLSDEVFKDFIISR